MNLTFVRVFVAAITLLGAGGCATITGEATQTINIQTVDANGKPVDGMACRIVNGSAEYMGDTPLFGLRVRKSPTPLIVECKRHGYAMARALVISRADLASGSTAQLLLPGGSSMLIVDHLSGFMYQYPRWVRPQVGSRHDFRPQRREGARPHARLGHAAVRRARALRQRRAGHQGRLISSAR